MSKNGSLLLIFLSACSLATALPSGALSEQAVQHFLLGHKAYSSLSKTRHKTAAEPVDNLEHLCQVLSVL